MFAGRASAIVIAVVAALIAPSHVFAAPECFGRPRTMPIGSTTGTPGNDVIIGTNGDDVVDGGGGNDRICGRDGFDQIQGGLGNDRISGGDGIDVLVGDVWNQSGSAGGTGDDLVLGGGGGDFIVGDSVGSTTAAGTGNDRLDGGGGANIIIGDSRAATNATGGGDDVIVKAVLAIGDSYSSASSNQPESFAGGSGDDRIELSAAGDTVPTAIGDSFAQAQGANSPTPDAQGDGGDDVIVGTSEADHIVGDHMTGPQVAGSASGAGADDISAGGGSDLVFGDSNFNGHTQKTTLGPDGDNDVLRGGGGPSDTLRAGPGDDTLSGGRGGSDICDGETGAADVASGSCESIPGVP